MLKQYKNKISIKVIEKGKIIKDDKGRTIYFCIVDSHMYRLEYNIKQKMAELLNELFCHVFINDTLSKNIILK